MNLFYRSRILILLLPMILGLTNGCGDITSTRSGILASITVSPSPATVGLNKSVTFQAVGLDTTRNFTSISPVWSVTGAIGTIDPNGNFRGAAEGTGTVTASASGLSGSASVTVTAKGTISGLVADSSAVKTAGIHISTLEYSQIKDTSAATGQFTLTNIPAGPVTVSTEATGIFLVTGEATIVGSGETKSLRLILPARFAITSQLINRNVFGEITSVSGSVVNVGATTATGVAVTYILTDVDFESGLPQTSLGTTRTSPANVNAGQTATFLVSLSPPLLSNFSQLTRRVSAEAF